MLSELEGTNAVIFFFFAYLLLKNLPEPPKRDFTFALEGLEKPARCRKERDSVMLNETKTSS